MALVRDNHHPLAECLQRNRLFTSMPLGNNAGTEIRTRLRLRSTVKGANNRLDVDAIVSYDRGNDAATPMLGEAPALLHAPSAQKSWVLQRCPWNGKVSAEGIIWIW